MLLHVDSEPDLQFEWNNGKAKSNFEKHGVTFETATGVFFDPFRVVVEDDRFDYGEIREIIYGMVDSSILVVVYVERDADVIRIISARHAEPRERQRYANG